MTSTVAQHNCQKAEQLTKKAWGWRWVVLVVSTKWHNISLVSRFMISKARAMPNRFLTTVYFLLFLFQTMYNKKMVRFGFCDLCYQLQPLARLITLTVIILDTTKTSSNNCLLFMHFSGDCSNTYCWRWKCWSCTRKAFWIWSWVCHSWWGTQARCVLFKISTCHVV